MHSHTLEQWQHEHQYRLDTRKGEESTRRVILLTVVMMTMEIIAGHLFGSMALLADGWHMGTHAAALSITVFAYMYARRHAANPRYSFSTGKVGVLGGFASAVVLAVVALLMGAESLQRFAAPVPIRFNEAIGVAIIGLLVNLVSAMLLQEQDHGPEHDGHNHGHPHAQGNDHDHNLKAAYLHVMADAMTSLLAIVALVTGKFYGWIWMDPLMGLVGGVVIGRWSYGLLRDTSRILLDSDVAPDRVAAIRAELEVDADNRVADLHVWRLSSHHLAVIVTVVTHFPRPPEHYKKILDRFDDIGHITVEVQHCQGEPCVSPMT